MLSFIKNLCGRINRTPSPAAPRRNSKSTVGLKVESLEKRDTPAAMTLGSLAGAVAYQIRLDAVKMANEVIRAESAARTPLCNQLVYDAQVLSNAANSGSLDAVFRAEVKLVNDANLDLVYAKAYRTNALAYSTSYVAAWGRVAQDMGAFLKIEGLISNQSKAPVSSASVESIGFGMLDSSMQNYFKTTYANAVKNYDPARPSGRIGSDSVAMMQNAGAQGSAAAGYFGNIMGSVYR